MKHCKLLKPFWLAALLMLSVISASAYDFMVNGIAYNKNSDGTSVTVTYTGLSSDNYSGLTTANIPSSVTHGGSSYSVTSIGSDAFYHCSGLTSVTIPNSVTSIGDRAFYVCSGLTGTLTIPNSVTSIDYGAFSGCSGLESIVVVNGNSVYDSRNYCNAIIKTATNTLIAGCKNTTIPNSVTSIGSGAFNGCSGLTGIIIPNSVTSIGNSAFADCSSLTSITIPNSVTSIGGEAFSGCSGLTGELIIHNSVAYIGNGAFSGCSGLESIVVVNGNSVYDSRNNCNAIIETATNTLIAGCKNTTIPNSVTSIGNKAFSGCSGLTSVTIPISVTSIGGYAFHHCSGLTSLTIGNSVTSIGEWAFSYCSGLTSIYNQINHPTDVTLEHNVFYGIDKTNCTLFVPPGRVNEYSNADQWKDFKNILAGDLPVVVYNPSSNTLTFYCDNIAHAGTVGPIPSNNTIQPWWSQDNEIGPNVRKVMFDSSFSRCHPTSGYYWFANMTNLTTIEGLQYLNTDQMVNMNGMFRNCSKLTSLDLSHFNTEKVTNMYGMFMDCSSFASLDLGSFNTSAVAHMEYMFYGCTNLTTINLASFNTLNVTSMLDMFSNCSKLTTLDLSSFNTAKVTDMTGMFSGCSALTTIYAGDGWSTAAVTESNSMFRNCTSLVGGKGTTYNANHIDKTYARVDGGTSSPGYLTAGSKAYAMWNASQKRLTFYYDKLYNDRNYPVYYLNTGNEDPGWITDGVSGNVRYVMFDASFADARPTSCYRWFDGMSDMYSTVSLEYLNTSEVTNMRKMFAGCAKLSTLILSRFNTAKVTDMSYMFNNCSQLVTIVVGDQWNIDRVSNSQYMFAGCNSILGCKGTVYNSANVTKAYAHIDEGASNPGYLSDAKPRGFRYNGIWYDNSNGSEVSIIPPQHYDHYAGEVVIPSQFTYKGNNYTPHLVESGAFTGSSVTRVDLPPTVSVIESGAFTGATSLKTLVIGWGYSPSYAQIGQGFAGGNATGFICYVKHTFLSKYEEMHPNAYFFAPWVQISETYYPELRPYRPFSCKYNVELPEGLEAYYVKGYDSSTRTAKTQKVTGALPSNTGFLLKGSECKIYLLGLNGENIPPITGNMLKPRLSTDQPWNQSDGNSYFFFNVGDIMWVSTVNISQGESYLCIPNSQLGSDLTSPIYLDLEGGGTSQNGDVNGDGRVNVSDVSTLINMILGITPTDKTRADVNGDGKVNVSDVTALINIILGIN